MTPILAVMMARVLISSTTTRAHVHRDSLDRTVPEVRITMLINQLSH